MSERCCGTCRFYEKGLPWFGTCRHPTTQFMRELVSHKMVPFAFVQLEVTTLDRTAGTDCPTYQERP